MFAIEFGSKRLCLQILLWSGLLFQSRCEKDWMEGDRSELGMVGSPVDYMTITITTTIAYKPTLAPGDSTYSLVGCYSHGPGGSRGGHPFGQEEGYASPTIPPGRLTIDACLKGCAALELPHRSSNQYEYIGLMNGGECFCGSQLDPKARKLSPEECQTPCSGDTRLSCGGPDTIAVYSRVAASEDPKASHTGNGNENIASRESPESHPYTHSAWYNPSSTSEGVVFRTAGAAGVTEGTSATWSLSSTTTTSPAPGTPGTPSTSSTIAAVTGGLSGAIILTALSVLCFRAYRRKKQKEDDAHVQGGDQKQGKQKKRNSRRPIPSAIDTKPGRASHLQGKSKDYDDSAINLGVATDFKDMVPTTPALESGGRIQHSGLHSRLKSPTSDRDTLYDTLMGEVRASPALPKPPQPPSSSTSGPSSSSAASSSVQWRGLPPQTPTTASAALFDFSFDASSRNPSGAGHAPAPRSGSGSGASLVSSPAAAARSEAALGARAWHRRKLSTPFQPPASGPPSMPLPLTPPQQQSKGSGSGLYAMGRGANVSARSLGAESVPPPTPPLKDSPTLPRKTQTQTQTQAQAASPQGAEGAMGAGAIRGGDGDGGEGRLGEEVGVAGAVPTIPYIAPSGESTPTRRRATMYAGPRDESEDDKSETSRSSLSASTVATSILFPLDDDDDRTWSGA